jgi:hypothetical protein
VREPGERNSFVGKIKKCVRKVLVPEIFLLKCPVFGERGASLPCTARER